MTAQFIRERNTQLRKQKGISEYRMSYDLGHSRGYINNISSGQALPSMQEFLAICEYFEITPIEFFDKNDASHRVVDQIYHKLAQLGREDRELVERTVDRLLKK